MTTIELVGVLVMVVLFAVFVSNAILHLIGTRCPSCREGRVRLDLGRTNSLVRQAYTCNKCGSTFDHRP
jgi:transposase-like protein